MKMCLMVNSILQGLNIVKTHTERTYLTWTPLKEWCLCIGTGRDAGVTGQGQQETVNRKKRKTFMCIMGQNQVIKDFTKLHHATYMCGCV